jgi:hypothetical protein
MARSAEILVNDLVNKYSIFLTAKCASRYDYTVRIVPVRFNLTPQADFHCPFSQRFGSA